MMAVLTDKEHIVQPAKERHLQGRAHQSFKHGTARSPFWKGCGHKTWAAVHQELPTTAMQPTFSVLSVCGAQQHHPNCQVKNLISDLGFHSIQRSQLILQEAEAPS